MNRKDQKMVAINTLNDILKFILEQDIKKSRQQIEEYINNQRFLILSSPYLKEYEITYQLNLLEQERQYLLGIQDKRELAKNVADFFNKISKTSENKEGKQ